MISRKSQRISEGDARGGVLDDSEDTPVPTGLAELSEPKRIREVVMPELRKPNSNPPGAPVSIARNDALPDFSVMIRVGSTGAIVKNKGGSEELAGVVAYTHRLVELVGELLGLDHFVAMECMFKETAGQVPSNASRCLLFREANGDTVALRPRADSNIQALRESLGL